MKPNNNLGMGEFISDQEIESHGRTRAKELRARYQALQDDRRQILDDVELLAAKIHSIYHWNSKFRLLVKADWRKCTLATCREFQRICQVGVFK